MTATRGPQSVAETPGQPGTLETGVRRSQGRATGQQSASCCGGCDARWTALGAAHCSGCHETFAGVGMFDAHRSQYGERGRCLDPGTIVGRNGLELMTWRNGMWRGPEASSDAKAALAAWRAQ